MSERFADSFYYLALWNRHDAYHERAEALSTSVRGGIVTTAWVLTEVADALSGRADRQGAVRLIGALRADPQCRIVPASQDLFERGWRLYAQRPDKDWSLTDCISFVVMRDHGITEALTADHHFEQAGFTILLEA
ncbi:type II toxin-antitoxin system VapC family toxin [Planctomycetota bacterium]